MIIKKETIMDFNSFIKEIENLQNAGMVFRGCTNKEYKLSPQYFRDIPDQWGEIASAKESDEEEFFRILNETIKDRKEKLKFYLQIQHCGIATRLLDFSHDYRIALLFACQDWLDEEKNKDIDGIVYVVNPKNFPEARRYSQDLLSELLFECDDGTVGLKIDYKYSFKEAKMNEISFFEPTEEQKKNNNRMQKQKACFLLFPKDSAVIKEMETTKCETYFIVPKSEKDNILKWLKDQKIYMDKIR